MGGGAARCSRGDSQNVAVCHKYRQNVAVCHKYRQNFTVCQHSPNGVSEWTTLTSLIILPSRDRDTGSYALSVAVILKELAGSDMVFPSTVRICSPAPCTVGASSEWKGSASWSSATSTQVRTCSNQASLLSNSPRMSTFSGCPRPYRWSLYVTLIGSHLNASKIAPK